MSMAVQASMQIMQWQKQQWYMHTICGTHVQCMYMYMHCMYTYMRWTYMFYSVVSTWWVEFHWSPCSWLVTQPLTFLNSDNTTVQEVWLPGGQLWHCSSGWQQCVWGEPVAVAVWAWKAAPGWSVSWKDWCQEEGCSEGAAPARSWDSPSSQGWSGLMENAVWLWSCTEVSVPCPNMYQHLCRCMYKVHTNIRMHEHVCTCLYTIYKCMYMYITCTYMFIYCKHVYTCLYSVQRRTYNFVQLCPCGHCQDSRCGV